VKIEFALELIEDFITGVDVKIFAPVGTAGNEGDEIRIIPDHPALSPVVAVFVDPSL
jgi:hypothetical protein